MATFTREEVIDRARRMASLHDGVLSRRKFRRESGICDHWVSTLFPGGWAEVRRLVGIARHPQFKQRFTADEVLAALHRVVCKLGRLPSSREFSEHSGIGRRTLRSRLGGPEATVEAYRRWLTVREPDAPILRKLPPMRVGRVRRGPTIEFGAPINCRGLRHAPTNEQGVVFLFALLSQNLGFVVEAIQTGFPDCEAKRSVDPRQGRWQRVRIEFEYRSRSFRDHGHEASGCDLIICWLHDWPDCPLEVIELRREVENVM